MKNILLSTLFALISTLGFSQLTYMPDDAFENYVETGSGVPFNNDNYVSTASIQLWNSVYIPVAVQDLTGIEDFGHIYVLNISSSNLTTIDLSNCPNILNSTFNTEAGMKIGIHNCAFLTTIIMPPNEIAFSILGCPYLTDVSFQSSNVIRNLTLGDPTANNAIITCPSLTCLDLSNVLDVKMGSSLLVGFNDNLLGLKLNNGNCNKWSTMDIIGNILLSCVQVDNPTFCNNAQSLGAWYFDCFDDPLSQCSYSTSCPNCIANVDELPTVSINISPNPTSSKITVKASLELIGKEFTIYDQLGKAVKSGVITSEETEIDLSNLTEGVYLFKAGAEMQETFKIIKQ